jgi:quinohemoprotein ethanol dehydrogenase
MTTRRLQGIRRAAAALLSAAAVTTAGAQTAVDDEAMAGPRADGQWLTYGGDYAETRFSTLDAINAGNVDRLALAFSVEVGSDGARLEATPLVVDGVLYATTTWNVIYAIDLGTQSVKWRWDPGIVRSTEAGGTRLCCGAVNRGPAYYDGKVYMGLLDGRLAALDAGTGEIVWIVQTAPPGPERVYSITSAPRVVKGKVIIGNAGADMGARGFVTAYDAETGEQAWRFYTVPGDPSLPFENPELEHAATTWTGDWWKRGGGGTTWDGIAYDPEADLLYVGTGNGGPWNRDLRSPGGGDNLYLSSILALRPDSGELLWYYQTTPGDNWDYTAVQQMILADLTIDGRNRSVLMQAPKNGFFYVLDRLTGELISAEPYARVNWASGIDPETGRPIEQPAARYGADAVELYPTARGAHNWHPMAFSPQTGLVYIPGVESSFVFRADLNSRNGFMFGAGSTPLDGPPHAPPSIGPGQPEGMPGFFVAWDPVTQSERWRIDFETREDGGALATAGNLVFGADSSGTLHAFHAATGEALWSTGLLDSIAPPITYEQDGVQYLAVLSGTRNNDPPGELFVFALDGRAGGTPAD